MTGEGGGTAGSSRDDARSGSLQRMVRRFRSIVGYAVCTKLPNRSNAYCCWRLWLLVALLKCSVHEWRSGGSVWDGVKFWRAVYLRSPQSDSGLRGGTDGNATHHHPRKA